MTLEDFGGFECQFGGKFVKFRCSFKSRYFGDHERPRYWFLKAF